MIKEQDRPRPPGIPTIGGQRCFTRICGEKPIGFPVVIDGFSTAQSRLRFVGVPHASGVTSLSARG